MNRPGRYLNVLGGTSNNYSMLIHLRKTLFAGVVVMVPIVVTIKVMEILFKFTDGILGNALTKLLKVHIPGLGLLLFLILIYIMGLVTRTFFGKNFLLWVEQVIDKVPVVRTVYSGVKQLLGPIGEDSQKAFGRAVLVEYPPGIHVYGFVTKDRVEGDGADGMTSVYVPFNHLHLGMVILAKRETITELDMSFEQMVKLQASCGTAMPNIKLANKPRTLS